jgi:hypothetical protein
MCGYISFVVGAVFGWLAVLGYQHIAKVQTEEAEEAGMLSPEDAKIIQDHIDRMKRTETCLRGRGANK